jgi:signal transduction histidine kinase
MRDVIWSIDTQNERFVNLIDRMNEYLNLIFEDTAIVVDFKHAISNSNEFVDLITKQNTYLIFKEAINNIVKHANSQNVKVRLQVKDNVLNLIIISDGIAKMAVQQGMGLKNMHSRAHKMNADLRIDLLNNYELHLTKYL